MAIQSHHHVWNQTLEPRMNRPIRTLGVEFESFVNFVVCGWSRPHLETPTLFARISKKTLCYVIGMALDDTAAEYDPSSRKSPAIPNK